MKSKKRQHQTKLGPELKPGQAAKYVLLSLVAAITFTSLINHCHRQYTLTGAYRREYEGRILDKSQTITESRQGSGVRRRLLIEGRGGERLEVAIGADTYERAQKGMWIRKTAEGIELTWPLQADESHAIETRR